MKFRCSIFSVITIVFLASNAYAQNIQVNISVDYTNPLAPVNSRAFGVDVTGYGNGMDISNDPTMRQNMTNLHAGQMRMDLKYAISGDPASAIQCGGAGCATNVSGDTWITQIKAMGAEPIVITQFIYNQSVTDAANLVKHFNIDTNNPVKYWIIGNESPLPNDQQVNIFNQMYDAMKAVDPTIKIGGTAPAYYNAGLLQDLLNGSGSRIDFLDFHHYGEGGSQNYSQSDLLNATVIYEQNVSQLKSMIRQTVPNRANAIDVQVGEWNTSWGGAGVNSNLYSEFNTVWGASVIGHIINAGGLSLQYGDKNGGLGTLYDTSANGVSADTPMPIYYSHFMYTGGNLFRHFGTTIVKSSTTLSKVEVFASDNDKNIVVVNKDPSVSAAAGFQLNGFSSGTAQVWQENANMPPSSPPSNLGSVNITDGSFTYVLPPYSVTTFVLNEYVTPTPTPPPAPTPTPTAPAVTVTDGQGNVWTLQNQIVYENGKPAGYTSGVVSLVYANGKIYQENTAGKWWYWNGNGWIATTAPVLPTPIPTPTPVPPTATVTDGQGNVWTLQNQIVYENGKPAGYTSGVVSLVYANGKIYQENAAGGWWYWNGNGWIATTAPSVISN